MELIDRNLTDEETELLLWLLAHGNEGASAFSAQVNVLRVFEKCTCGCPTIYLKSAGQPSTRKGETILSDFMGYVEEDLVGVMVFESGGHLSSLEVYSCAGNTEPFGLPKIASLCLFEDAAQHAASRTNRILKQEQK